MSKLLETFSEERKCNYKNERYSVRDNGSILRYTPGGEKSRPLDNHWTFGTVRPEKGYPFIGQHEVHRIVATAFLGNPPTPQHVVDHIDTNRQNNRPDNLRWVTRLENIILNDITRAKLEALCHCSIDKILADMSILHNIYLTPNFEWMRAVSQDEASRSLESWRKWSIEIKKRKFNEYIASQRQKQNESYRKYGNYPLEPKTISLEEYNNNLEIGRLFYETTYSEGKANYIIADFNYNRESEEITVATKYNSGVKSYYVTKISIKNKQFDYDTSSYFDPSGVERDMALSRGEKWEGFVFDDYC